MVRKSSDAGANVAVIIVRLIFISAFLFYCLLSNHIFQTSPNSVTNCFKLFLSITTLQLRCSCVAILIFETGTSVTVRIQSIQTMTHLCNVLNFSDYASRMVHSFARLLESVSGIRKRHSGNGGDDHNSNDSAVLSSNNNEDTNKNNRSTSIRNSINSNEDMTSTTALIKPTMDALCALARQLGDGFSIFAPTVSRLLRRCNISHVEYSECIRLLNAKQLFPNNYSPIDGDGTGYGTDGANNGFGGMNGANSMLTMDEPIVDRGGASAKLHVNQQNLQRSWTTRQRR